MIQLHLTHAEHEALLATLAVSHRKQIDVEIKNRDEKTISSLSAPANKVLDGAVQIDGQASPSRVLDSLTIVDEKRKLRFEADSPAHGAAFGNRFVRINYRVYVPSTVTTWEGDTITGIGDWVPIPLFHGPVSHYSRQGVEVTINAQGKEALMMDPRVVHEAYTLHKGMTFENAIRKVAQTQGETRFDIPNLPGKLQRPRVVQRGAEAWRVIAGDKKVHGFKRKVPIFDKPIHGPIGYTQKPAHGLVHSIEGHRVAFYNGRGQLCVRKLNRQPSYVFRWGRDFTSRPELDFDQEAIRNFVRVLGKKLKHNKRAEGHATLDNSHPYSPQKLAWHDIPQYLEHKVTAEHLDTDRKCQIHAQQILRRITQMATDLTFAALPIPLLEEDDMVEVLTPEYKLILPIRQLSIPLASGDVMSFGRHKRVKLRKRVQIGGGGEVGGGAGGTGGSGRRRHRHHHHHHHRHRK